jgi:hypothetical protein
MSDESSVFIRSVQMYKVKKNGEAMLALKYLAEAGGCCCPMAGTNDKGCLPWTHVVTGAQGAF